MTTKQKFGCVFSLLGVFVVTPIWYYLLFSILKLVEATELMWFLYWVYVPVGILIGAIGEVVKSAFDEK